MVIINHQNYYFRTFIIITIIITKTSTMAVKYLIKIIIISFINEPYSPIISFWYFTTIRKFPPPNSYWSKSKDEKLMK